MSKAAKTVIVPWKKPCKLRQEIRDRELGEADFAVDLNKVIFGVPGGTLPFYCDPVQFFATSYSGTSKRFARGMAATIPSAEANLALLIAVFWPWALTRI